MTNENILELSGFFKNLLNTPAKSIAEAKALIQFEAKLSTSATEIGAVVRKLTQYTPEEIDVIKHAEMLQNCLDDSKRVSLYKEFKASKEKLKDPEEFERKEKAAGEYLREECNVQLPALDEEFIPASLPMRLLKLLITI